MKLSGTSSQVDYAKALVEEKVQAEKLFRLQNANKGIILVSLHLFIFAEQRIISYIGTV